MADIVDIAAGDGAMLLKAINGGNKFIRHHRRNCLTGEKTVDIRESHGFIFVRLWRGNGDVERNDPARTLLVSVAQKILRDNVTLIFDGEIQLREDFFEMCSSDRDIVMQAEVKIEIHREAIEEIAHGGACSAFKTEHSRKPAIIGNRREKAQHPRTVNGIMRVWNQHSDGE